MSELNVLTLNVRGLLSNTTQYSLKQLCYNHKLDIVFLQETYVSNMKISKAVR